MAVKAKEQVTVSWIIDIASTTKYYLLQSSTATPPSKPTANPPGGNWKTAEPAYTSGSTNTLYTIEQTLWTNGKVTYSAVCKSSSYEAAKEAWNKAQNAQNTANSANSKIDGLEVGGRNLIANSDFSNGLNGWANSGAKIASASDDVQGTACKIVPAGEQKRIYQNVQNVWKSGQVFSYSFFAKIDNTTTKLTSIKNWEYMGTGIVAVSVKSDTEISISGEKPGAYSRACADITNLLVPGVKYILTYTQVAGNKAGTVNIDEATDAKFTNLTLANATRFTVVSGRYYRLNVYVNAKNAASTESYTNSYNNISLLPTNYKNAKLTPSRSMTDLGTAHLLTSAWARYSGKIKSAGTFSAGTLSLQCSELGVPYLVTKIKLEKGNVATDWTPAPEDTDIKIESYVESEIKKEEDSIKLWVGQTYTAKTEFNTLSGRTSTLETWKNEASQKITKDGIIATVGSYYTKESDFQSATTRITNAESRIAQLNDSIELKVEKNGIISAINQTSEKVTIAASKVDLSGYVSISNLKTAGKTVIEGSNITTGTV